MFVGNQLATTHAIRAGAKVLNATVVSGLDITVKNLKPRGEQTVRPLHTSSRYMLSGLSRFLRSVIIPTLKSEAPHILYDSQTLAFELSLLAPRSGDFFIKVDIREFYMTGSPRQITDSILELLHGHSAGQKRLLRRATKLLLNHQYVSHPITCELFQVIIGTGMGLPHSGEFANGSLYQTMESSNISHSVLNNFQVRRYWRYRDDALILANSEIIADFTPWQYVDRLKSSTSYNLKV